MNTNVQAPATRMYSAVVCPSCGSFDGGVVRNPSHREVVELAQDNLFDNGIRWDDFSHKGDIVTGDWQITTYYRKGVEVARVAITRNN